MFLTAVRHGETPYNVERRFTGSSDVPLTEKGRQQARDLSALLSNREFDLIVSSHKIRAMQTAEIIRKKHPNTPFLVMEEFSERNLGVYEGLTHKEAEEKYPELWKKEEHCICLPHDAPYGGETVRQFEARIRAGLDRLRTDYKNKRVLIVCHGFTIHIFHYMEAGIPYNHSLKIEVGNCAAMDFHL